LESIAMALAHVLALLKKFIRGVAAGIAEARELRRTMSRRFPHIEE
jgi:hypothetical protein